MILSFDGVDPDIGEDVFVADDAKVIGRVTIGDRSSIWYGCVVRGDVGTIVIGDETNIQDLTTIHITGERFNTRIGSRVTVGHRAILHGCTIEDDVLIGMGAIVLDGAVVGITLVQQFWDKEVGCDRFKKSYKSGGHGHVCLWLSLGMPSAAGRMNLA